MLCRGPPEAESMQVLQSRLDFSSKVKKKQAISRVLYIPIRLADQNWLSFI